VIFGSGSDQSNSPNVDLLYALFDGDVDLGDRILEGVQVAHDIVDFVDVLICQVFFVCLRIFGQNSCVDCRVQGLSHSQPGASVRVRDATYLDTATDHLRTFCNGADIIDGKAALAEQSRRASRCQQPDIVPDQALGQIQQPSLVIYRNNCRLWRLRITLHRHIR
jgi:hypothetical protein